MRSYAGRAIMRTAMLHPVSISGSARASWTASARTDSTGTNPALAASGTNPIEIPSVAMGLSHPDPIMIDGISHSYPINHMGFPMGSHGISSRKSFRSWDQLEMEFFDAAKVGE